jgi:signal recognition particle subunit SRP54
MHQQMAGMMKKMRTKGGMKAMMGAASQAGMSPADLARMGGQQLPGMGSGGLPGLGNGLPGLGGTKK